MKGKILVTWRISLVFSNLEKIFNLRLDSFIIDWQTSFIGKLDTVEGVRKIRCSNNISAIVFRLQLYSVNSVYLLQNNDAENAARFSMTFFRASK